MNKSSQDLIGNTLGMRKTLSVTPTARRRHPIASLSPGSACDGYGPGPSAAGLASIAAGQLLARRIEERPGSGRK